MVSDLRCGAGLIQLLFQSALRFAVVSDGQQLKSSPRWMQFQSALRFAVVSDMTSGIMFTVFGFQSALRFAVVSDL